VQPSLYPRFETLLAEAENAGVPMPSISVVRDRLITGIARGYAGLDWTALGLVAAEKAGLQLLPPWWVAPTLRRNWLCRCRQAVMSSGPRGPSTMTAYLTESKSPS
jgi:hypothetical protein